MSEKVSFSGHSMRSPLYHYFERSSLFQVKAIMAGLPHDGDGRIKIEHFLTKDIHSPEAFHVSSLHEEGRFDQTNQSFVLLRP